MAETPWTPEMPLRADATDEQIRMRAHWLWVDAGAPAHGAPYIPIAAREFAAACVAQERETMRHCGNCGGLVWPNYSLPVPAAGVSEDTAREVLDAAMRWYMTDEDDDVAGVAALVELEDACKSHGTAVGQEITARAARRPVPTEER